MPKEAVSLASAPGRYSEWRNVGRRLGCFASPSVEAEATPVSHLAPEARFFAERVAVVGGRRFLQLADGSGWAPERSRKDPSRIVLEYVASGASAGANPTKASSLPSADSLPPVRLRHLRLTISATRSANTASVQIGQLALRCRGSPLDLSGFAVSNPGGRSPPSEQAPKLLGVKGKWLDLCFRERGRSVLVLSAPLAIDVEDLALRTAGDAAARDPVALRVEGSLDGYEWLLLHELDHELYVPTARLTWSPWLQLRPDSAAAGTGPPQQQLVPLPPRSLPGELSWWRNTGRKLGVLEAPRTELEPVDHLQVGATFAALRLDVAPDGRRFLQLAGGRGWVAERSRKDAGRTVVELAADQEAPVPSLAETSAPPAAKRRRIGDAEGQERAPSPAASAAAAHSPSPRVRYIRIVVLAARSANVVSVQIAQVCLRHNGDLLSLTDFAAANPRGQSPASEGPSRVLAAGGKWLDMNFRTNQRSVLELKAPRDVFVDDFCFCTASDGAARDPTRLRVDGSLDGQAWFVLHDTGDDFPAPLARRAWSPWLLLRHRGSSTEVWPTDSPIADVPRYRCQVAACSDSCAKEGYLVEGKLLRHLLRHHAGSSQAVELQELLSNRRKRRRAKTSSSAPPLAAGGFARRSHARSGRLPVGVDKARVSSSSSSQLVSAAAAPRTPPGAEKRGGGATAHVTVTPARENRAGDAAIGEGMTPSPPLARTVPRPLPLRSAVPAGAKSKDRPVRPQGAPLVRLPAVLSGEAPCGSLVDVEAVVANAGEIMMRKVRLRNGALVKMRRCILREGQASCMWVLTGSRAERYSAAMLNGRRVVVRGARVRLFRDCRHLSGCERVDVCLDAASCN